MLFPPGTQTRPLSIQKKRSSKGSRHIKDHRLCLKLVCKTLWWMPPKKSWNSSIPVPCISAGFSPSSIHEIDHFWRYGKCVELGSCFWRFCKKNSAFSWNSDTQNLEKIGGFFTKSLKPKIDKAWCWRVPKKKKTYPFKESGFEDMIAWNLENYIHRWLHISWMIPNHYVTKICVSPCPSNEKDPSVLLSRSRMSLNMRGQPKSNGETNGWFTWSQLPRNRSNIHRWIRLVLVIF